mmetsp:Transcript_34504/g.82199  ORF Transcript_34504/g.82199 Transcript_34504/m.82199 type:complete len:233 (+) Transcript_34504:116-814(+)
MLQPPRSELQQGAATCERRLRPYLPLALRPYAALRQAWPSSDPLGDRGPVLPLPPRGAWHALAVGDAVDEVLPLRRALARAARRLCRGHLLLLLLLLDLRLVVLVRLLEGDGEVVQDAEDVLGLGLGVLGIVGLELVDRRLRLGVHGGERLDLGARLGLEEAHRVGELGDLVELHLRLHLLEAGLELRQLARLVLPDAARGSLEVRHLLSQEQRRRHLPGGTLLLEARSDVV